MWAAGPNSPTGPPREDPPPDGPPPEARRGPHFEGLPPGGPPAAGRSPARPGAGWYALPVALLLATAAGVLWVLVRTCDAAEVAAGPSTAGDPRAGMFVELAEGRTYFLYVRGDVSGPYACAVTVAGESGPLRLTRENSRSAGAVAGHRYTATFRAPRAGTALLTCRGSHGPVLVVPDGTVRWYRAVALLSALAMAGAAVLAFAVIYLKRRRTAEEAVPR